MSRAFAPIKRAPRKQAAPATAKTTRVVQAPVAPPVQVPAAQTSQQAPVVQTRPQAPVQAPVMTAVLPPTVTPPAPSAKPWRPDLAAPQVLGSVSVPAPRHVKQLDEPLTNLESTQTVRALTAPEIEDDAGTRWFAIQLSLADHAFDPDAVPNLDIFSEYRLYSVRGIDQGRTMHALRLGFFSEEIAAAAVASYLAAHYDKPTIKRVSVAERERFSEQRVEARKDVGETGRHAVIEITNDLVARYKRTPVTASAPETSNQTGRWSLSPDRS
jgi:hypothetical protein